MNIGILGCGYVGQALARECVNRGHHVTVTTRKNERIPQLKQIAHKVFLIETNQKYETFLEHLEVLIITVAPDSSANYYDTYVETCKEICYALPYAKKLSMIIYTSSTSVYGDHHGKWVNEESNCLPFNLNSQLLLEAEQILLNCSKHHVCIFRLGEIYGPGRLIENRLKNSVGKTFPGSGQSYTNLIHLNDIVNAITFVIDKQLSGLFNLCSDFHITRKEFYDLLCQQHQLPPISWNPALQNPHSGNKRICCKKITDLGFTFGYHYQDNLEKEN